MPVLSPPPVPRRLSPAAGRAARLRAALQEGVSVAALVPCTVLDFLVGQLGLDASYVERRISTLFLDGQVVDDAGGAFLRDGSVLALSAALPGLAGASLRKGGFYASLRAGITRHAEAGSGAAQPGAITLKLFNLIIGEVAPAVLAHGLLLDAGRAAALLADLGEPPAPPGAAVVLTTSEAGVK